MTNINYGPQANPSYSPIPSSHEMYPKEAAMSAYPQALLQHDLPQQAEAQDPARTLGIVGLILSVFANVVGLVMSIVAYRKSRRAGFRNGAALAGIVIGLLTTLGLVTASVVGGLAAKSVLDTCRELGPGQHVVNGVTYTCG